ncbi:macrolide family glycosyltransferase [Streptomyces sp. NPDC020965]|uniref:macrolide family glycosyltransferase n=1 Tax=Streptomyces sp. NPDC020965 TaxID=3365105 RepID=UPI003791B36E
MSPHSRTARPGDGPAAGTPGLHVLWFGFPAYGHIKPTLGVVEELIGRGHRVTYVVADRLAARVAETGARVVPYSSPFPESITTTGGVDLATTMLMGFVEESFAPLETALECAAADRPDVIVHDALASDTAVAVGRRHGVPTVRTYAGFGTNDQVPLNGTENQPDQVPADPTDPRLRELGARLTARIEAAGVADLLADGMASGDDAALNVSFVTREFQIRGETFGDDYLFAGPCPRPADYAGSWKPPESAAPVLLVSLGTSTNRRPDFFRGCAETFAETPWHVVMTLGTGVDPASLGPLPPNVEAHPWIQHPVVLEHATAFVCQGGTGSLMEAFHQGVPAVVVPQQWDAHATAQHVVDLGLGRAIPPADLDAESLRVAVDAVAADVPTRRRVEEMRRSTRRAPGAVGVAERLETIADRGVQ